VIPTKVS